MRPRPQPISPLMTVYRSRPRRGLQKKVQLPSRSAPFRKHFSIHLTRKGVSFSGNFWALPLSRAFNIPFNRGVLHILSAHLPSQMKHGTEITALALTQICVFIQHNSTLPRDANSGPRINRVSSHYQACTIKSFPTFQQGLYCSGTMSQKRPAVVSGSIKWVRRPKCCSAVQLSWAYSSNCKEQVLLPLFQYQSCAEWSCRELNQLKTNPTKQKAFSVCVPE